MSSEIKFLLLINSNLKLNRHISVRVIILNNIPLGYKIHEEGFLLPTEI